MERVGAVLRNLEGETPLQQRLAQAQAFARWPEIVGELLAERTRPLRVADRRLFVLAQGAALRQELTFHKRSILRKLNAAVPGFAKEIVFLEADAMNYEGESRYVKWTAEPEDALRAPVEQTPEPPAEEEAPVVDRGAMYDTFDAEAYRAEMEETRDT
ncbi:MAG: DUF721 domain-containing protein [Gemmatimonadetes bacterium]|nr:DUF721 domain-containing protein [Gemmatimonadota bacterium]